MIDSLLASNNLDINFVDNSGKNALFYAVHNSNVTAAQKLISRGIDLDRMNYVAYHRDNLLCSCYEPPIVTAARVGSEQLVQLLIDHGASVNDQSEIRKRDDVPQKDKSALHLACESSRLDIVKLLLAHQAQANVQDKSHELPIHKVVRCKECSKQTEILKLLCDHGSDVNRFNKVDCSVLYLATFYRCYHKMDILLLYGADGNQSGARDNSYGTPLHVVAAKDRMDLAELLIQHGVKLNIPNALQCTPLQLNINMLSKSQVAQLLVYHGAQCNGVDKWNLTLMASCIRNMRLDCELLAKLFVYAGYNLNKDHWLRPLEMRNSIEADDILDVPIPPGRVQRLCDWLRERQQNPLHLVDICRISVRDVVRRASSESSIVQPVQCLPLPNALKDFLLLKDFMTFLT